MTLPCSSRFRAASFMAGILRAGSLLASDGFSGLKHPPIVGNSRRISRKCFFMKQSALSSLSSKPARSLWPHLLIPREVHRDVVLIAADEALALLGVDPLERAVGAIKPAALLAAAADFDGDAFHFFAAIVTRGV